MSQACAREEQKREGPLPVRETQPSIEDRQRQKQSSLLFFSENKQELRGQIKLNSWFLQFLENLSSKGKQWIFVIRVYSGSDWGSIEALHCLCFCFFLVDSLFVLLLLYLFFLVNSLCAPVTVCYAAFWTRTLWTHLFQCNWGQKDLLWSGVFRRLSHT